MRLILDDTTPVACRDCDKPSYHKSETIEITDAEWDDIFNGYMMYFNNHVTREFIEGFAWKPEVLKTPSQYLRDLIELKK